MQEYSLSMKKVLRLAALFSSIILVTTFISPANAATSLLNKSCPKVKGTKVNNGVNLVCKSIAGKKVWVVATKSNLKVPINAPAFTLVYSPTGSNTKTPAVLIGIYGVTEEQIKRDAITGFYVSARADGEWTTPYFLSIGKSDLVVQGQKVWASNYEVSPNALGKDITVRVQTVTSGRVSNWSVPQTVSTLISTPTSNPTPSPTLPVTPSPTPTRTATPTPAPVTSAPPTAEIGCSVNYLSPLPYASQRMAIINMVWEKDSAGYVSVIASIRNDNSMALRLVNYTFYFMHKGSIITTTSTLEGDHHFYIQDDAKFNSLDGASGPWTPGQVRTFRIPTNQMLECRSISILSAGFNVKQGIGAS